MRRRSTPPAMSLFPFLDTLVCTMGALILMLLAMTPKIKERAQARLQAQMAALAPTLTADPDPEPEPVLEPEPEPAPEPVAVAAAPDRAQREEDRAAERKRRREAWFKTAADARESLAARQADYRKRQQLIKETEQRLKDLQDQILKSQLKTETVEKADQSLAAIAVRLEEQQEHIAQEIAKTRKNIDVLNRRQASARNEYSLVPYDGTSGTARRPIYIECTGKGFRFLPEDETVSPTDLEGFADNYNPLLTGAQSLVRFWARRRRNSPESEPEPYVLLLVRPSGCITYYLARKYLSSLSVNFGYELIEEDWKLSVPDPDPIAKSLLKDTLDTTVQARRPPKNAFADADQGFGDAFDSREFARSGRSNHFGPPDDDDNRAGFGSGNANGRGMGRRPFIRLGPATRAGRNAAGTSADDDPLAESGGGNGSATGPVTGPITGAGARTAGAGGGTGPGTTAARAAGMRGGSRTGTGSGDGDSDSDGGTFPSRAGTAVSGSARGKPGRPGTSDGDSIGGIGSLLPDDQARDSGGNSGTRLHGGKEGSSGAGSLLGGAGRGGRQGRGGSSRPATLGGSGSEFGSDDDTGDGDEPLELMPSDSSDRLLGGEGPPGTGGSGFNPTLRPLASNSKNKTDQNPFDLSGDGPGSADGSSSRGSSTGTPSSTMPSGAPSSSRSTSSNSPASDSPGSSGASQGDPATANSSAGGSASSVQFGGPGATVSLGSGKKAKANPKDDDPDAGPRIPEGDGKAGGQMVRSRGPRKWGQVGKKASIGFEKKIEIRLMSDRILVGSKDVAVPVKRSDSDDEIVGRVVNAIDYVADKWGEPPSNYYWVPAVRFVVYPGGDQYSAKLSKVLEQKYAVNSTIDFAEDKPVKKTVPRGRP